MVLLLVVVVVFIVVISERVITMMNPEQRRVVNENIAAAIRMNASQIAHYTNERKGAMSESLHYAGKPLGTLRGLRADSVNKIINILLEELEHLKLLQLVYSDNGGGAASTGGEKTTTDL